MTAAERMKTMRRRRWTGGLREVRLHLPDARVPRVRKRIATQVAKLSKVNEEDALRWIEAVSEFDADATR
jgi:hypothetical protein